MLWMYEGKYFVLSKFSREDTSEVDYWCNESNAKRNACEREGNENGILKLCNWRKQVWPTQIEMCSVERRHSWDHVLFVTREASLQQAACQRLHYDYRIENTKYTLWQLHPFLNPVCIVRIWNTGEV